MTPIRRVLIPALMVLLMASGTAPALAGDRPGDGRLAAVMTPADIAGQAGRVSDTMARDLGPTIPTSCEPPSGRMPEGREAPVTLYGEVDLSTGTMWQNSVYVYPSPAAARDSFVRLRTQTAAQCRGEAFSPFGDDEESAPNVVAAASRRWSPSSGLPGFTSATSVIFLDLASAPPGYRDLFAFQAFVLAGDAIVEVNVSSPSPLDPGQRDVARSVADAVAGRLTWRS